MSPTRAALVREATRLIRHKGYGGFSYADLSGAVGIAKASIHHHFPAKADLGLAVVAEYTASLSGELDAILAVEESTAGRIRHYADLYVQGLRDGHGCLCGTLAAESATVPPLVRAAIARFFEVNREFLARVVREGAERGEVLAGVDPVAASAGLLASLQGASTLAKVSGDSTVVERVLGSMLRGLLAGSDQSVAGVPA